LEAVPRKAAIVSSEIQINDNLLGADHYYEFDVPESTAAEITCLTRSNIGINGEIARFIEWIFQNQWFSQQIWCTP